METLCLNGHFRGIIKYQTRHKYECFLLGVEIHTFRSGVFGTVWKFGHVVTPDVFGLSVCDISIRVTGKTDVVGILLEPSPEPGSGRQSGGVRGARLDCCFRAAAAAISPE